MPCNSWCISCNARDVLATPKICTIWTSPRIKNHAHCACRVILALQWSANISQKSLAHVLLCAARPIFSVETTKTIIKCEQDSSCHTDVHFVRRKTNTNFNNSSTKKGFSAYSFIFSLLVEWGNLNSNSSSPNPLSLQLSLFLCNAYGTDDCSMARCFFMVNCETFIYLFCFIVVVVIWFWSVDAVTVSWIYSTVYIHNILLGMHRLIALNSQLGAHKQKEKKKKHFSHVHESNRRHRELLSRV